MGMKLIPPSQRSQDRSWPIAEPQSSGLHAEDGAATAKAAPARRLRSGVALLLIAAGGLLAASLVTACSQLTQTLTVDFVYVLSAKAAGANQYGEINVYEINSESGHMRQIPTSPFPSAGRNPVAEAVSADYANLFVVNQDDNTIVQFVIGSDGKLYPFNTVNTPGIFPMAVAANKANLFVVDTYEPLPLCSTADPCPGSIGVFPLSAGGSSSSAPCTATVCIGAPAVNSSVSGSYWPLALSGANASHVIVPTGVNVLASGSYVYVTAYDSSVSPSVGYVFGFVVGSGGELTPLSGSPFAAGVQPTAIASDPSSTYVYVTDFVKGDVLGYWVVPTRTTSSSPTTLPSGVTCPPPTPGGTPQTGTTTDPSGTLCTLANSPFHSGTQPTAIVVDPSYSYAYVTNSLDATVAAFSMSSGKLTSVGTFSTGLDPVAIGIDPSTNHFLYTVNFLDNTVSGFELSTTAGTLLDSQGSPFTTDAQPTAVTAIPHNGTGGGIQP
jgi:6-phosphogluconolactonase